MLLQAAKVDSCQEHKKNVILLLDEMHIWESIVFDKHREAMIGFTKLGDVNDYLMQFERSLVEDHRSSPLLAKSMMVFIVQSLINKL